MQAIITELLPINNTMMVMVSLRKSKLTVDSICLNLQVMTFLIPLKSSCYTESHIVSTDKSTTDREDQSITVNKYGDIHI